MASLRTFTLAIVVTLAAVVPTFFTFSAFAGSI